MDVATIGGVLIGILTIAIGIVINARSVSVLFTTFLSIESIFITIGGSFFAVMASNTLQRTLRFGRVLRNAMRMQSFEPGRIISMIVTFSEKARREGLLALEDDLDELEDAFLRKGIQLVVDGTDPEIIRNIMETELNNMITRHEQGIKLFDDWGLFAPAFGMIGTLIGLINMLRNLGTGDTTVIGAGMSAALLTTLYGAVFANSVLIPVANKLTYNNEQEVLLREIMIEGTLSIQSGDNPRIVKEKLVSFLAPEIRAQVEEEAGEGE
jgi:chemotaxis protein MotA